MHPYEEIRIELLRRINKQVWPAGAVLPHEEELADEFNVSRGTMRRALTGLVEAGLIERRRRAGTRVVNRKGHASTLTIPIVRHEITAQGNQYGYKLLTTGIGGNELDRAGVFSGARLRHVLCLHLSDGRPWQLEDRVINIEKVPEAADADFSQLSPNEWLVERVPFSSVRTTLSADNAGGDEASHLRLNKGAAVFVIERQTRIEKVPLTYVRMSHPSAGFRMVTQTGDFES